MIGSNALYVDIDALTDKFTKKLNSVFGDLDGLSDKLKGVGAVLTVGLSTPLIAAAFHMKNLASDMEESTNKVDVAFKGSADVIKAFSKTTLTEFGIAQGSALEMASLYGDMATGMGVNTEAAAEMSKSLVGLAGNLMSYKNIGLDVANTAIKSIFTGETEPFKNLGVVMTEANLKAFALTQGLNSNIQAMSESEKIALRYQFALDKTKNAQGDFARTSDGAANQSRIFQERLKEIGAMFGEMILPLFTKGMVFINGLAESFSKLDPTIKKTILVLGGVAALLGPIAVGIGIILPLLPAITAGFATLTAILAGVTLPMVAIGAAIGVLAVVIYKNWDSIKKTLTDNHFFQGFTNLFKGAFGIVLSIFDVFKNVLSGNWMEAGEALLNVWKNAWNSIIGATQIALGAIGKGMSQLLETIGFKSLAKAISQGTDAFVEFAEKSKFEIKKVEEGVGALAKFLDGLELPPVNTTTTTTAGAAIEPELSGFAKMDIDGLLGIDKIKAAKVEFAKAFAGILDIDLSGSASNLADRMDGVIKSVKPVITNMGTKLQQFIGAMNDDIKAGLEMGISTLANGLAEGLASVFNQDVKFDPRKMIAQMLSSIGDMLVSIATPLVAALALGNAATWGGMSFNLAGASGMLAAGVAMKAGGMAMSANIASSSNSGISTPSNYGGGTGSTFRTMDVNITGTLRGEGTALVGVIEQTNTKWNG